MKKKTEYTVILKDKAGNVLTVEEAREKIVATGKFKRFLRVISSKCNEACFICVRNRCKFQKLVMVGNKATCRSGWYLTKEQHRQLVRMNQLKEQWDREDKEELEFVF